MLQPQSLKLSVISVRVHDLLIRDYENDITSLPPLRAHANINVIQKISSASRIQFGTWF